ncbi:MAG: WhiB family transcriptional regulator [bacterium]|nr:WhiB family transcriptional regulator [bacterium]
MSSDLLSGLAWTNPDWMNHAACTDALQDEDTDDAAIAICRQCPVVQPCLSFALSRDETDGVWGGLTYDDRRLLTSLGRIEPLAG